MSLGPDIVLVILSLLVVVSVFLVLYRVRPRRRRCLVEPCSDEPPDDR